MGEEALLKGCTTVTRLLFECQKYYSHDYFKFIDYVIDKSNLTVPNIDGFSKLLKSQFVVVDASWKELFY